MSVGKISEFNIRSDNWRLYVERLEQYFIVNNIKEELKVPTLITVIGADCYELLVDLCTPDKPSSKSFVDLTKVLEKHLQPKPSILAERYKFRHRKQNCDETVSDYVAVLKKMSKTCEFKTWLEESLRDQFVCGIRCETIRQRLFTEDDLDFARAYYLAVSMETAEKNAAVVQGRADVQGASGASVAVCQAVEGAWAGSRQPASRAKGGRAPRAPLGSAVAGRCGERAPQGAAQLARGAAAAQAARGQRQREQRCGACGGPHDLARCQFARYVCRVCNKQGHLRRVCPYMTGHHNLGVAESVGNESTNSEDSEEVTVVGINQLSLGLCKPLILTVNIHGKNVKMECDTGSAVSCISHEFYFKYLKDLELNTCGLILRYYTGELVRPVGVIRPLVVYEGLRKYLDLYVVRDAKTSLLGRQWLVELKVQLPRFGYDKVNHLSSESFNFKDFSSRYCEVFADGLGRFTGGKVGIHVRPGARPVFLRARPLAYALREPVERVLEQLVRDNILTPVDRSDWATPIVPVVKKDGTIRICADFKLTLNKVIEVDRYPLPRVEDLLARLHGGEMFSKIDLSQAYAQFELDETKKYAVINTHKGLFRYNRLVFGLSSSPGIFQKRLEQLFSDLPHVGVFLDDIIITGRNTSEHIDNLHKVFDRLASSGLRVKREKCVFFHESINYLGHVISKHGIQTCSEKVDAVVNTPAPTTVSELRSFIGMVMYYAKFIKNVSTILAPLYELLRANVKFVWTKECETSFMYIKKQLSSSEVLVHYSPNLPLVLTADASSVGVGAIISHVTPDGERPIAYASRSLSPAERAYAQIDREALSIIYGIRKFHQYLYGRQFTLRTDHKPLTYIFGNKSGIPTMAASRLQRWAVLLSGYSYEIEHVSSHKNCADALSRLPQTGSVGTVGKETTYIHFVEQFLPVTNDNVRLATSKDSLLSRVVFYVQSGWPHTCTEELKPYFNKRNELYIDRGCLMWGYRLIIPAALRNTVLNQLHASHMGIVKTKSLARSYVWWPGVDSDVEAVCRQCDTCAAEAQAPPRAPPRPWPYDVRPWSRLHIDFLGPMNGKTFMVLIDSSSKWLEVFDMPKTNASFVIKALRATFARFGLPTEIVSDQGPPFTSAEFSEFLKNNGIRQSFSPVYHPASNGAAENAVKLCKRFIKKAMRESTDVDAALQTFLLSYRNSVHSSTGESPAMLLQRRPLRSRLDLLRGERAREDCVRDAQSRQVAHAGGVLRTLAPGDQVAARSYGGSDKWRNGTVVNSEGSRRYILDSGDGRLISRHIDQIRRKSRLSGVPCPKDVNKSNDKKDIGAPSLDGVGEEVANEGGREHESVSEGRVVDARLDDSGSSCSPLPSTPESPVTRPKRVIKPVLRYGIDY